VSPATAPLGSTGPRITALGLGAWAMGGGDWGHQDDRASVAAIHRALEVGINWVDTAAAYGRGHSEEVVARALRGLSDPPLVFTKCGPDLRPAEIQRECEASLRRLEVQRLDMLQFHAPDTVTGTPVEESWGTLADLVDQGKVRWAGVSNFGVDLLQRCEAVAHVDCVQPPLNAIDRAAAREVLPWCQAHGAGVIAYSPMMSGLLTDGFSARRMAELDPADWRHGLRRVFGEPALSRNLALRDALRPIAERHETTVAAVAVAWTLAWPAVTGAIVGARRPEQVDGWADALRLELDGADLGALAAAIAATGAGRGPADPRLAREGRPPGGSARR
jgi:aryl-alcohol dehydrogenase-like predicted oxidoreductase